LTRKQAAFHMYISPHVHTHT